jgi:Ca2+-transporting ATPase
MHAGTMAFMTLALAQTLHALNTRSTRESIFGRRLFVNPWLWSALGVCLALQAAAVVVPFLQRVLRLAPLTLADWAVVMAGALAPLVIVETVKLVQRTGGSR